MAMVKSAVNFQKALTLVRYCINLEGKRNLNPLLKLDQACLSKFIGLVQQHFDLSKGTSHQDEAKSTKLSIYDLFEMIRTNGVSRLTLKKTLLMELEAKQTIYCKRLV